MSNLQTKVTIDGSPMEIDPEMTKLGEVFDKVKGALPKERIVSQLFLDDREALEQEHAALRDTELGTVATIRFVTASLSRQVEENVGELLNFLKELRPVLRQASRELRFGAVPDATTKLADCFTGLDTAVRNIEQLMSVLPGLSAGFSEAELAYFSASENDLLGELVKDFTNKDWLSVADRIEFQLDPLMGRWQTVLNRVSTTLKNPPTVN